MAAITNPAPSTSAPATGEHVHVPSWMFAVALLGVFAAYVVLQENGWVMSNWMAVHEFFHDGRHALGLPCH